MKSVVVKGEKRVALGKKDAKKLRAQEIVPAVLYGGEEVLHFAVPFSELRKIIYTPSVFLVDLEIDGETHKAIMQDIQWHPVEEKVLHVDFYRISDDKLIKIEVPINVIGLAPGIAAGGKLKINLRRLKVKALAKDVPDTIDIDVTMVELGQSIKVSELAVENLDFLDSKSNVVLAVNVTRLAKIDDVDEELPTEEGEEGAEAEEKTSEE